MRHVVKSFVYLEDSDKYPELNKIYAKFFPEDPPARTTLGVAQVPGASRLEITCIAYTDLAEKKRIGDPPAGLPVQPGHPGGRHALRLGQGRSARRRRPSRDVRGAGPPGDEERRGHAQTGRARLPPRRDEPRLPRQVREPRGRQQGLQGVLRGRQRAGLLHGVRRLDSRRIARRDHLHRHDRSGRPQGGPAGRPEGLSIEGAVAASPAVWAGNTLYVSAIDGSRPREGSGAATWPSRSTRWPATTAPCSRRPD